MAKTVKKKASKAAEKPEAATVTKKTAAKKTAKKKVAKKAVAKKAAAKKKVVKKGVTPSAVSPTRSVTAAERYRMIQEGAYLLAEARGFADGDPNADWLTAEAEVDARLKKSGVTVTK